MIYLYQIIILQTCRLYRDIKQHVFPWDLDILSREIVLNCNDGQKKDLGNWRDLRQAINMIRGLEDTAFKYGEENQPDMMVELYRMAHRQFPWQNRDNALLITRTLKIYGEDAVDRLVNQQFGMNVEEYISLGIAVSGSFNSRAYLNCNSNYESLGIKTHSSKEFFQRISSKKHEIRKIIEKYQQYNFDWIYSYNPLRQKPLINFDSNHPELLCCPMPWYLIRRIYDGIFYDFVNNDDFGNPFGSSFEKYIGDVLNITCKSPDFTISNEQPYMIGSNKMHGVDWILSDNTGNLFIEAKTKRLQMDSKFLADRSKLSLDLEIMAKAVVQNYKNISRSISGITKWIPNNLPIYPLIIRLDNWFLFTPSLVNILKNHALALLKKANIPEKILEEIPYIIASVSEFEIISQIIAKVGVDPVMSLFIKSDKRGWPLMPIISSKFPEHISKANPFLFKDDFNELFKNIAKKFGKLNL